MSIFSKSNLPESDLKRNTFDLSFQNNLTTNFGVLKPVFCKEVLPGDTFDIDVTFGLRFMPTVFPIQNRARASVKFFYVRNRSLYEDFKEWSTGNDENLEGLPYLSFQNLGSPSSPFKSYQDFFTFMSLGGLADSLGIPVSRTVEKGLFNPVSITATESDEGQLYDSSSSSSSSWCARFSMCPLDLLVSDIYTNSSGLTIDSFPIGKDVPYLPQTSNHYLSTGGTFFQGSSSYDLASAFADPYSSALITTVGNFSQGGLAQQNIVPFLASSAGLTLSASLSSWACSNIVDPDTGVIYDSMYTSKMWSDLFRTHVLYPVIVSATLQSSTYYLDYPILHAIGTPVTSLSDVAMLTVPDDIDWSTLPPTPLDSEGRSARLGRTPFFAVLAVPRSTSSNSECFSGTFSSLGWTTDFFLGAELDEGSRYLFSGQWSLPYTQSVSAAPLIWAASSMPDVFYHPFVSMTGISAMPFRAYEMIYNSFYRDERNNPFQIDGVSYYDKFLPTYKGGSDTTYYQLHHVNWEQDQFTTALPSPQQGTAPLVGISSTGKATLVDTDGQLVDVQLETADDGDTVVSYSQTSDLSPAVQRTLVNAATSGISINDFRAVNALQRYLEKNLRQGLRYKDMIASRWGVSPSYSELNMPEFIGGVVEDVIPSQVNNNTASSSSEPLGSYAGQLYCQGSSKHRIHKFCDEPGYIMGILDITPVPVYNSLFPKYFTKFDVLDFFNPEFGHVGYQPIPVGELAVHTLSGSQGNGRTYSQTFGYQRAWYDYLCSNDEVHGDFRGSLRDFVIYRDFVNVPSLSEEFLTVSDKETNNIFSVQTDADGNEIDKILGQLYFDVKAKRPIPRFGIPRLE